MFETEAVVRDEVSCSTCLETGGVSADTLQIASPTGTDKFTRLTGAGFEGAELVKVAGMFVAKGESSGPLMKIRGKPCDATDRAIAIFRSSGEEIQGVIGRDEGMVCSGGHETYSCRCIWPFTGRRLKDN